MGKVGSAEIASILRRDITRGLYGANDRLPSSRQLAEQHGVARNTLRDALARLEDEGFVETRAGSGTYVVFSRANSGLSAIENASPLELIDARFALEPHICRLCVLHGRRDDFDEMDALCTEMEQSVDDSGRFADADAEFHRKLASTTRNNLLIWIMSQISSVRLQDDWTRMRHLTLDQAIIRQYNAQHRQILNAMRSREPERAANVMKEHLETARLSLTRAMET